MMKSLSQKGDQTEIEKYLDSIDKNSSISDNKIITGNKIIDVVIYQKSEQCRDKGIKFVFYPNNISFDFVEEADICCILSNLLDNAIEAAEKSADKTVKMEFFRNSDNNMYFIEIENSCDTKPEKSSGHFVTSKKDKQKHGIGIYSVEKMVRKYKGESELCYIAETKTFKTSVMIHR